MKNIPDAVKEAALKGAKGESRMLTGGFLGTLANNGVSIAPYHEFDSKVAAELKAEVDKLKADIIAGTVKVDLPGSAEVSGRPAGHSRSHRGGTGCSAAGPIVNNSPHHTV